MASAGLEQGGLAFHGDGFLFHEHRGHRFEGYPEIDVLSVADAALDTSAPVGAGGDALWRGDEDVVLFASPLCHSGKALPVFEAFHGVDGEHGASQGRVEFAERRFAQSDGAMLDDSRDNAADGVALSFYFSDEAFHFFRFGRVGTTHHVGFDE